MLNPIGWVLGGFWLMATTWVLYLAIMNLIRAKEAGTLTWQAKIFAYPLAAIGITYDAVLNITVGSVIFLELPQIKKLLLTARLNKHCGTDTWRGALARWICHNLLDPFDPSGKHCKPD